MNENTKDERTAEEIHESLKFVDALAKKHGVIGINKDGSLKFKSNNTLCEIKYEDITLAELLETGLFFELDADKQVARILKRG